MHLEWMGRWSFMVDTEIRTLTKGAFLPMKRGDGVAGILFLILWSVAFITPAAAGPPAIDADGPDGGSSALVIRSIRVASCEAGDKACGEDLGRHDLLPQALNPWIWKRFISDYESLRSRSPERLVMAQGRTLGRRSPLRIPGSSPRIGQGSRRSPKHPPI